jgi:hypothetical protein
MKRLNQFRVDFEDNTSITFMAKDVRAASNALETDDKLITQLSRVAVGVGIEAPIRNVKFNVVVTPEGAALNKCLATPDTWVVPEGTKVIFSAIPADGFKFDGWFREDVLLSDKLVAEIPVDYPVDPGALAAEFEARFSPVVE